MLLLPCYFYNLFEFFFVILYIHSACFDVRTGAYYIINYFFFLLLLLPSSIFVLSLLCCGTVPVQVPGTINTGRHNITTLTVILLLSSAASTKVFFFFYLLSIIIFYKILIHGFLSRYVPKQY